MGSSVIVGYARTPFGKLGGSLAALPAVSLGGAAIRAAMDRATIQPQEVEHVLMGMAVQAGSGQIPARQAAILAGLPWETPCTTINKVCASGIKSIGLVDTLIRAGDVRVAIGGGMESMTNVPYALPGMRRGQRFGDGVVQDLLTHDGLTCAFHHASMGELGDEVAAEYGVTRQQQDEWALRSHLRAVEALDQGVLASEIVPVDVVTALGKNNVVEDESIRRDTSLKQLASLPPVFRENGTITAGNAPGINDGAAALCMMSASYAEQTGRTVLASILGYAEVATEAKYLAVAPGLAIKKLLDRTGYRLKDIHLFEVNEAFAAVTLTTGKLLAWDDEKVNVQGGAIAFGHPIGATGTRIVGTLIKELRRRGGGLGIAAICSGSAQGDAILVRVD